MELSMNLPDEGLAKAGPLSFPGPPSGMMGGEFQGSKSEVRMPSVAVDYSRLIRPFPTKRLADALYHVTAEAHSIEQAVIRLLVDPPRTPDDWTAALYGLETSLASLSARCGDASPLLARMVDQADSDFQRARDAVVLLMRGMQATGVEQGEPKDIAA